MVPRGSGTRQFWWERNGWQVLAQKLLPEVDRTKQDTAIMGYRQCSQGNGYPKIEEGGLRKEE